MEKGQPIRRVIDRVSILLVSVSVILELYALVEERKDLGSATGESGTVWFTGAFILVSLMVLRGLIRAVN